MSEQTLDGEPSTDHTDGIAEPLNVPVTFDITAAMRVGENTWEVKMHSDNGVAVVTHDDGQWNCTCGDCQQVTFVETSADARDIDGPAIHMGTPPKEAQRTRRQARCIHAAVVQESLDHPCPDCDGLQHSTRAFRNRGQVVATTRTCHGCGHPLD